MVDFVPAPTEQIGDIDDVQEPIHIQHEDHLVNVQSYEQLRNENIARNKQKMAKLRMESISKEMRTSGNENVEKEPVKSKKVKEVRNKKDISSLDVNRRTTRSSALSIEAGIKRTVANVSAGGSAEKTMAAEKRVEKRITIEENGAEVTTQLDKIYLRKNRKEGVETMENYLSLRQRQKEATSPQQMESIDPPTETSQCENDLIVQNTSQVSHESGAYDNDEDRLANRPDDVPLEEFKILLKYWGDKKVQERAKKKAENRKCVKDTHTSGPKSYAQLKHKMKRQNPNKVAPSNAELYIETRKRHKERSCKASNDYVKSKIQGLKICSQRETIVGWMIRVLIHPMEVYSFMVGKENL